MTEPPTLAELARAVGLNQAKLKLGFRTLFGSPVFAYLRDLRMDEARRLLQPSSRTPVSIRPRA